MKMELKDGGGWLLLNDLRWTKRITWSIWRIPYCLFKHI